MAHHEFASATAVDGKILSLLFYVLVITKSVSLESNKESPREPSPLSARWPSVPPTLPRRSRR